MSWLPQVWLACCLIAAACTHRARCSPSPPPAVVHALSQRGSHTFTVTTNHGRDPSDWMWEGIRHSYQLCDYYKDTNKHRATMWSGGNGERPFYTFLLVKCIQNVVKAQFMLLHTALHFRGECTFLLCHLYLSAIDFTYKAYDQLIKYNTLIFIGFSHLLLFRLTQVGVV